MRGDGVSATPVIALDNPFGIMVVGTPSTTWQYFDHTFSSITSSRDLVLGSINISGAAAVEFDNILLTKEDIPYPEPNGKSNIRYLQVQAVNDTTGDAYAEGDATHVDALAFQVRGWTWGDGAGTIPEVQYRRRSDGAWITGWTGIDSAARQYISFNVTAGMDAIRLYATNSVNGFVLFDRISIIDPDIERASVSAERREELRRQILKYKPLHSWAILVVQYV
jgi:hypothetical protein